MKVIHDISHEHLKKKTPRYLVTTPYPFALRPENKNRARTPGALIHQEKGAAVGPLRQLSLGCRPSVATKVALDFQNVQLQIECRETHQQVIDF